MGGASLTETRTNLSEIVDKVVATGEAWTVTRHGTPVAVVVSHEEYESLIESLNILSDPETMAAIREAEHEVIA